MVPFVVPLPAVVGIAICVVFRMPVGASLIHAAEAEGSDPPSEEVTSHTYAPPSTPDSTTSFKKY
jgi:hypothetical protein